MYIWISKIIFNFVAVVCLKLYTVDVCYISWDIFVSGITEITDAATSFCVFAPWFLLVCCGGLLVCLVCHTTACYTWYQVLHVYLVAERIGILVYCAY